MREAHEKLMNAIIIQAVKDYRAALKILKKHPRDALAINNLKEIEKFFRSEYFSFLTSLDPEILIQKLQEEVEIQ